MDIDIKESELQARSRIVKNQLTERNNCIVLKIDTHMSKVEDMSPFGFHFEFDAKKYKERKRQIRKQKITRLFAWVAYYHHKFGIRHITLVSLLIGYVFLGGFMFEKLESQRELSDLKKTIVLMQGIIDEETTDIINVTLSTNGTDRVNKLGKLIKRYYKTMLEAEGRFHGSVWHKAENLDMHLMWYFSSATFYSMTLFSTIGYGTISCQTAWGRTLSIIYASIGLPIMLVVLGDIGEWFQKVLTTGYTFLLFKYKKLRKQPIKKKRGEVLLPMWLALFLVLAYILICTVTIKMFDHNEGNKPGIGFFDAFYFTFISLTTIGLGDVMPYNIQYSPFLAAAFLLGLALISIVNTSIYAQLYQMFFNMINNVEEQLDNIHNSNNRGPGYRIFQQIKLRTRTESDIPVHDGLHLWMTKRAQKRQMEKEQAEAMSSRRRAPTLGAFGGFDLSLFSPRGRANTSPFRRNESEETEESDVE
uniref:Potassium channel domain-containing protein n=1 Tax=Caenorhabditis japonica TaxID=281687 RepID=A0A8R1E035_CAEJA